MPDPWSTYPNYLPPGINLAKEAREREARRTAPFVVIEYYPHRGAWKAICGDKVDRLGRFEGTREQCIAWARERCDDIRICADPYDVTAPMVQLGPDDA